jgi:hypothetical protein
MWWLIAGMVILAGLGAVYLPDPCMGDGSSKCCRHCKGDEYSNCKGDE